MLSAVARSVCKSAIADSIASLFDSKSVTIFFFVSFSSSYIIGMVGYLCVAIMEEPANTLVPGETMISYELGIVTWEPEPSKIRPSRAPFSTDCPGDTSNSMRFVILPCISRTSISSASVEMVIR